MDGGRNYYARFSNTVPARASYFPIGVWFESVRSQADVAKDKRAGLNTYVVLTADSNLSRVRSNHMRAILQSDEFSPHPSINGWFLADEVDMTHGPSTGYDEMQRVADATPRDGRVRYSNYGKGVLFSESDGEAARFVNDYQDIVSADAYWFTDENICQGTEGGALVAGGAPLSPAECHRAANYGATVRRVRGLVSPAGSRPVWAFVELGHPFSESDWPTITPPQVRAAVWQSLIAGARGIVYFNHSFGGPHQSQHILRDGAVAGSFYASIRREVAATNSQIKALAPVLNSPTVRSGWSQGPGTTAMVKWALGEKTTKKCKSKKDKNGKKCKKGRLYLFAGSAGAAVEGRFSLACVGDTKAAVVGENRTVPVGRGTFRDHFADGNAIHIYRIPLGPKCASPRRAPVTPVGLPGGGGGGGHPAPSSNDLFRVIIAAIVVLLLGLAAAYGRRRMPGRRPLRSGNREAR